MSLNVKLAMLVCMAFISGVSYIVSITEPAEREVPSPLIDSGRIADERTAESNDELDWLGAPVGWRKRFARMSPVDLQLSRSRGADRIQIVTTPAGPADEGIVRLPPLARPEETAAAREDATPVRPEPQVAADEPLRPDGARLAGAADAEPTITVDSFESAHTNRAAATPSTYEVLSGDSLGKVARRVWGTENRTALDALLQANPGVARRKGKLLAGEVLVIPASEPQSGVSDRAAERSRTKIAKEAERKQSPARREKVSHRRGSSAVAAR